MSQTIEQAVATVQAGGVIVYPTESVFGLGCDPFNERAVLKLLKIKQRPVSKGLILIASHVEQILPCIKPINSDDLANALKTWPGHHTWVFPKSKQIPSWVSGEHETIAVRVSKHKTVVELCEGLGHPLISTSANIAGQKVLSTLSEIKNCFGKHVDAYVDAALGQEAKPSQIRNAHTLEVYR